MFDCLVKFFNLDFNFDFFVQPSDDFVYRNSTPPTCTMESYTYGYCGTDKNFDLDNYSYLNDESYQYEMKIASLNRQIELISKKVLYMEEHIRDLNGENTNLKKQLNNIEELYKKKIQIREDEIESLKEIILGLEENNSELKLKEQDLLSQKRVHIEQELWLQQRVSLINYITGFNCLISIYFVFLV